MKCNIRKQFLSRNDGSTCSPTAGHEIPDLAGSPMDVAFAWIGSDKLFAIGGKTANQSAKRMKPSFLTTSLPVQKLIDILKSNGQSTLKKYPARSLIYLFSITNACEIHNLHNSIQIIGHCSTQSIFIQICKKGQKNVYQIPKNSLSLSIPL